MGFNSSTINFTKSAPFNFLTKFISTISCNLNFVSIFSCFKVFMIIDFESSGNEEFSNSSNNLKYFLLQNCNKDLCQYKMLKDLKYHLNYF